MSDGQKIAGRAVIPVKDMALESLEHILPQCSKEEIEALRAGRRPDGWSAEGRGVPGDPVQAVESYRGGFPLVSCILVFGGPVERMRMPRKAVNQFVAQSYPRRQLIIVNGSGEPITNRPHPFIKEKAVESGLTIGAMRNIGLSLADGEYVLPCWDDDDVYDIHRLIYQMAFAKPGFATLLSNQIRFDIDRATVYDHCQPEGIPSTMIVPRPLPEQRFQDANVGEATAFWVEHFGVQSIVIDNSQFGANVVSMAAYHGANATPREEFMVNHSSSDLDGHWELSPEETEYVRAMLSTFGLEAESHAVENRPELVSADAPS